jgi:hypothetical protein
MTLILKVKFEIKEYFMIEGLVPNEHYEFKRYRF